jgi:tRNA (guanine37-N1)-methyltransferase
MQFHVITLFPEPVLAYARASILGRAAQAGLLGVTAVDLRPFGEGRHRKVDDAPYGGGAGMVMMPGPLVAALESTRAAIPAGRRVRSILLGPAGRPLSRAVARELAADWDDLVLVCGRYEGVDARVEDFVDEEISLGDFVLTGGEIAAMAVVDAVSRLLPGVLGSEESPIHESFEGPLLEHPQYTRPPEFRGRAVPELLLSGDHGRVAEWRAREALRRTLRRRPELLGPREALPADLQRLLDRLDSDRKDV